MGTETITAYSFQSYDIIMNQMFFTSQLLAESTAEVPLPAHIDSVIQDCNLAKKNFFKY